MGWNERITKRKDNRSANKCSHVVDLEMVRSTICGLTQQAVKRSKRPTDHLTSQLANWLAGCVRGVEPIDTSIIKGSDDSDGVALEILVSDFDLTPLFVMTFSSPLTFLKLFLMKPFLKIYL